MANTTTTFALPPLPDYSLKPLPSLIPGFADVYLSLALPVIAYWVVSMFFHVLDTWDLFPQYRLHTPAEVLKRNPASRWEVFRDVIVQQVVQTVVGVLFSMLEPPPTFGKEEYDIAWWAQKIRLLEKSFPVLLGLVGLDVPALVGKLGSAHSNLAGAISGGAYPQFQQVIMLAGEPTLVPAFAPWEILVAKAIYHVGVPALQFAVGVMIVDTWQYFLHRAMHMNKWLYTTFHSRHHRLYVPYAYGALYNHPFEGFLLDTVGTGIAYMVAGMSVRQTMWFFTMSTIKTVDDHCGYSFPWDPLQHITGNNAGYHDVHHQSWGIKTNFSQPFFTFWDGLLGTKWTGGDVNARYERARIAAQKKVDADKQSSITDSLSAESSVDTSKDRTSQLKPYESELSSASSSALSAHTTGKYDIPAGKAAYQAAGSRQQILDDPNGGARILAEEAAEEARAQEQTQSYRRQSPRKRTTSTGLKGLADRVGESLQGTAAAGCGGITVEGGNKTLR